MLLLILSCFILTAINVGSQNYGNLNYKVRNTLTLSMTLTVLFFFTFKYFINYETLSFISKGFTFFKDPWFYIILCLNFLTQITSRKCAKINEKNIVFIQYALLFVVASSPLFSYISINFLGFIGASKVDYKSMYELFEFSFILYIIAILFIYDKIKTKSLNRPLLLFIYIILSTITSVLFVHMMQVYDTISYYFCSILFNSFFWIYLLRKNNEINNIEKRHLIMFPIFGGAYILYSYVNVYLANNYSSEQVIAVKCVISILIAASIDLYNSKQSNLKIKDWFLTALLVFSLYYYTF